MTNDEGVAAMGSNDTRDTVEVARITMPIDALAFAACRDGSAACGEPLHPRLPEGGNRNER